MTLATKQTKDLPDALHFTVDSQLMGELGERLVTRNHVALAELVKNAYDADASRISIEFCEYLDEESDEPPAQHRVAATTATACALPRLMPIGCVSRRPTRRESRSRPPYGRPKTGNKGIGRFACQRLANELVLTTVAKIGSDV